MTGRRAASTFLAAFAILAGACTSTPAQPGASPTTTVAPTAAASPTPATVPLLRIATQQDESTWSPWTYISGYPGWMFLLLQFDTLLNFDLDGVPQPWLAKEVRASDDSRTWTLVLESGVKWHDGRPFTAEDVKFTFEYFKAKVHGRFSAPVSDLESATVQGTDTVALTFAAPKAGFRVVLADIPMLPKHVWEGQEDPRKYTDLKGNTGTGPYQLVEYQRDQLYRFKANPEYFKGAPLVDEIVVPVITDANATFSALRAGQIDATVRSLQPELVREFEGSGDLKVARGPDYTSIAMWINTERPTLGRKEVRQAISYALDRKRIIDTVYLGFATMGSLGFIHPENPAVKPGLTPVYDVAKANQLLDGIGAARGADGIRVLAGERLSFEMLVLSAHGPLRLRTAELAGQMLKEVGIESTIKVMEFGAFNNVAWRSNDTCQGRDYDYAMNGWTGPVQFDLDRLVQILHSDCKIGRLNTYGFKSEAADRIALQLRAEADPAKRIQLAQQLQEIIADELPILTLFYADGLYAYDASVYDGWGFLKGIGIFQKNSFLMR